ncbi:MAG: hypothetical protein ACI837_001016 [Crocinitomicaceae bacterium]|jgi:hypothetical protein
MIKETVNKKMLFLLGFTYLILLSCNFNGNYLGVSLSISESKRDGFIVNEYNIKNAHFSIDTLGELKILEAFIESKWRSNDDLSKSKISGYQMILRLADDIPLRYSFDWVFKIDGGKKFTENHEVILVADVFEDQMKDTIKINIFQGDVFYLDSMNQVKNQIILVRKSLNPK